MKLNLIKNLIKKVESMKKNYRKALSFFLAILICTSILAGNTVNALSSESIGSARIIEFYSKLSGGIYGLAVRKPLYVNNRLTPKPIPLSDKMTQSERQKNLLIRRRGHSEAVIVNDTVSYGVLRFFRDPTGRELLPTKEVKIGGTRDAKGKYVFPCTMSGNAAIEWISSAGERKCKIQIPDNRKKSLSVDGKDKAHSSKIVLAKAFSKIESETLPNRRYYCSVASTLGESPGFKGRAWDIETSPQGDLFSQEDPCQKAVYECQRNNPGLACSVINTGEWTVDDTSELVAVTLNCAGRLIDPDGKPVKSSAVDSRIEWLRKTAKNRGEGSCVLDIHSADEIILSPGSATSRYGVIVQAETQGDGIAVRAMKGSVDVQFTDPTKSEKIARIPPDKECTFFPLTGVATGEDCKKALPIPPATKEEILENRGFQALVGADILAVLRDPSDGVDLEGQTTKTSRCLGGTLTLPAGWKLIQNRKHFNIAKNYVQRTNPQLASAYVASSLDGLKQASPPIGSLFQEDLKRYLSLDECQLLAIDTQGLAGISIERKKFAYSTSVQELAQTYGKQIQQIADPNLIKLISQPNQDLTVDGEPAWVVQAEVTLKGAYGQVFPGYQNTPPIGAGRTIYLEEREGDSVRLAHTTYLFRNKFAKNQDEYFVMSFVTTRDLADQYKTTFKEIAQAFRFLKVDS